MFKDPQPLINLGPKFSGDVYTMIRNTAILYNYKKPNWKWFKIISRHTMRFFFLDRLLAVSLTLKMTLVSSKLNGKVFCKKFPQYNFPLNVPTNSYFQSILSSHSDLIIILIQQTAQACLLQLFVHSCQHLSVWVSSSTSNWLKAARHVWGQYLNLITWPTLPSLTGNVGMRHPISYL